MTQNQRQNKDRCKQFVNFSKHVANFAKNSHIYVKRRKRGQNTKEMQRKEEKHGDGKAL